MATTNAGVEVVYGGLDTGDTYSGQKGVPVDTSEEPPSMSDKVQGIASTVYREFEVLIEQYGSSVVHNLMPLVVGILENLDELYRGRHHMETEVELLKEDNNQLMSQYDREKLARRAADEKILHIEDSFDEEKKGLTSKMDSLESIVRMLELKGKNAQDHITRLEEREAELKKENQRLLERYTDTLRLHMDFVERTKLQQQQHLAAVANQNARGGQRGFVGSRSGQAGAASDGDEEGDRGGDAADNEEPMGSVPDRKSEFDQGINYDATSAGAGFDELQLTEGDATSDDGDQEASELPSRSAAAGRGILYGVMSREIDKLIKENMELVETKNALNIVKDDLITRVEDLLGENILVRGQLESASSVRETMKLRLTCVEQELRDVQQQLEKALQHAQTLEQGDEDLPPSQRKRFTRTEMARVLMERNQYKERLIELQEAVRWTEMIRASKEHPDILPPQKKKPNAIQNLFSNLIANLKQAAESDEDTRLTSCPVRTSPSNLTEKPSPKSQRAATNQESTTSPSRLRLVRDGRSQVYGWSIANEKRNRLPSIAIPVYCGGIGRGPRAAQFDVSCAVVVEQDENSGRNSPAKTTVWLIGAASQSASTSSQGCVCVIDPSDPRRTDYDFFLPADCVATCAVHWSSSHWVQSTTEVAGTVAVTSTTGQQDVNMECRQREIVITRHTDFPKGTPTLASFVLIGCTNGDILVYSTDVDVGNCWVTLRLPVDYVPSQLVCVEGCIFVGCANFQLVAINTGGRLPQHWPTSMPCETIRFNRVVPEQHPLATTYLAYCRKLRHLVVGVGHYCATFDWIESGICCRKWFRVSDTGRVTGLHACSCHGVWISLHGDVDNNCQVQLVTCHNDIQPIQTLHLSDTILRLIDKNAWTSGSHVRATAVLCAGDMLWIGTDAGLLGQLEFAGSAADSTLIGVDAGSLRVSCHGYRCPVQVLLPLPSRRQSGDSSVPCQLVLAVGAAYQDWRPADCNDVTGPQRMKPCQPSSPHLLLWRTDSIVHT